MMALWSHWLRHDLSLFVPWGDTVHTVISSAHAPSIGSIDPATIYMAFRLDTVLFHNWFMIDHNRVYIFICTKCQGAYKQEGEWLFMRVDSDRTRGNGLKRRQRRFMLDIRRKFFTQRVVKHWNRVPKEAVGVPSLEAFKSRLDVALGSLVWWLVTLRIAGGLKLFDHCGPFQPRPFCDSIQAFEKRTKCRWNHSKLWPADLLVCWIHTPFLQLFSYAFPSIYIFLIF